MATKTRNGRFDVGPLIRKGRSDVYSGVCAELGYPVAVKVPTGPDAQASLEREWAALRRCRHTHVVRLLDVTAAPDGRPCLVLDWLDGATLERSIQTQRRLDTGRAAWMARQLLAAVEKAHRLEIVVGDLQPSNVMIAPEAPAERLTLFDFGSAYGTGAVDPERPLGTLPYAAPELLKGERPTVRSDVFAIGAILYEALSGRRPERLEGANGPAPIDALVPVTPGFARIIGRCMAIDPRDRFPSVATVADALEQVDPDLLVREGIAPAEGALSPAPEVRTVELVDAPEQDRITLPRGDAPADARRVAPLRSTEAPHVWICTGDPAVDSLARGIGEDGVGPGVRAVRLDQGERADQLDALAAGDTPLPWSVVFGSSHAHDPMLLWIGARSVETARILLADHPSAAELRHVVNGPGVDLIVAPSEFSDALGRMLSHVKDRRRAYDEFRLMLQDVLDDTTALQARLEPGLGPADGQEPNGHSA